MVWTVLCSRHFQALAAAFWILSSRDNEQSRSSRAGSDSAQIHCPRHSGSAVSRGWLISQLQISQVLLPVPTHDGECQVYCKASPHRRGFFLQQIFFNNKKIKVEVASWWRARAPGTALLTNIQVQQRFNFHILVNHFILQAPTSLFNLTLWSISSQYSKV